MANGDWANVENDFLRARRPQVAARLVSGCAVGRKRQPTDPLDEVTGSLGRRGERQLWPEGNPAGHDCKEILITGADRWRNPDEDLPADFEIRRAGHYASLRKRPRTAETARGGRRPGRRPPVGHHKP